MFKTPAVAAFSAAWRALCGSTLTPHYRTAFQELPAELIPRLMVLEAVPTDKYIIRFMGTVRTQMWGADLTGRDIVSLMSPQVATPARKNMATSLLHPCGMYYVVNVVTPSGREAITKHITVPAANDPGYAQRLVNFAEEISILAYTDPRPVIQDISERRWIDVGVGVPTKPPAK